MDVRPAKPERHNFERNFYEEPTGEQAFALEVNGVLRVMTKSLLAGDNEGTWLDMRKRLLVGLV